MPKSRTVWVMKRMVALMVATLATAGGILATEGQESAGDDVHSASPGAAAVERYLAEGCSTCDADDGIDVALGPALFRDGAVSVAYHTEGREEGTELVVAVVAGDLAADATTGERSGTGGGRKAVVRAVVLPDRSHGTATLRTAADLDPARSGVIALLQERGSRRILAADRREITMEPATLRGRVVAETGKTGKTGKTGETGESGESGPATADASGVEGVEGVRVLVCSDFVCVPAVSKADGTFAVTGIPAGVYRVRIGTTEGREIARLSLSSGEDRALAEPIVLR